LNFELARPFGLKSIPSFESTIAIGPHFSLPIKPTPTSVKNIDLSKAIVLHPKSQGSAIEWPIEKYYALSQQLIQSGKTVLITGTEKEGEMIRKQFYFSQHLIDLTGQLTLSELIALLAKVKVVVACSTGPIHIAAILGTPTIALFSSRKPIHPGRWRPLGAKSKVLVFDENCQNCKNGKQCHCLEEIPVELLIKQIDVL
jgi:ADP-heptose:LPS heptosyltransferase